MTPEPAKHALGLAASTISGASKGGARREGATPTSASIAASADRAVTAVVRDNHAAASLEQAGILMLLIICWVGLHALRLAGKPF